MDEGPDIKGFMEHAVPINLVMSVLLGLVGVLLYRLLNGIDENTKATASLNVTVEKLGMSLISESEKRDQLEKDLAEKWEQNHQTNEIVRARLHDAINAITTNTLKLGMLTDRVIRLEGKN